MTPERKPQYNHQAIESKWQRRWTEQQTFRAEDASDKPTFYGLVFFPYPSGAGISVGHCRNYIPVDVVCRYKAMQGYNVLQPMGWDAFGLPAENEAIAKARNPREMVPEYAANYKRQLNLVGNGYDWSREIDSSRPDYYRWTQWFFVLLYRRGLAYRAVSPINWCPSCATGLANEEVAGTRCWRCGTLVEKRPMPQWYFRITAYADRLLEGLDTVDWPEGIKAMQREWLGRSEGAEVEFEIRAGTGQQPLSIFTTRPDTLWGATFMVLAPEHPLVQEITTAAQRANVQEYVARAQQLSDIDRQSTSRPKTGVFTGAHAVNPVNGQAIPIYVADYVLMSYGTGAIMAVPAHDQRDFEFAKAHGIPIALVYTTDSDQTADSPTEAVPEGGVMAAFVPSPDAKAGTEFPFAGMPNNRETVDKVIHWLEDRGIGRGVVRYRMRDWLISRQRYWGAPIPIVHCERCGEVPVPEEQLPVLLPEVDRYEPAGTGESPLAGVPEFVNVPCPACGRPSRRETDTMGGFACSSWYFLRFADPHNADEPFSRAAVDRWLPIDLYSGGREHAVMHLLYARFWTKVMFDAGLIGFEEPFPCLRSQGMLLARTPGRELSPDEIGGTGGDGESESIENWKVLRPEERETIPDSEWVWRWIKMSKSKGNVVTPDEIAARYGADALRVYTLFVAPYEEDVRWNEQPLAGAFRYVRRVWRLWHDLRPHYRKDWQKVLPVELQAPAIKSLRSTLHQTIRKVGDDIEAFRFNTAVAALMTFTNELSALRNALADRAPSDEESALAAECIEALPLLLSPITPHMTEELWEDLGHTSSIYHAPWPEVDEAAIAEEVVEIAIQINGRICDRLSVPVGAADAEIEQQVLEREHVMSRLGHRNVRKVIVVPGRLVNIVSG